MKKNGSTPTTMRAVLIATLVLPFVGGCALIQPPPIPSIPRFGLRAYRGGSDCTADISQAHAAFAAAGAAAGDPAATAAAHAAAASAMSAYHVCLAQNGQP